MTQPKQKHTLRDHGMINLRIPIDPPPTHQAALRILKNSSGNMFVGKQSNSKAAKWAKQFATSLKNYKPSSPLDGAVRLTVTFAYPLLKKHDGKREVLAKITRPDCDNLVKIVLDVLVKEGFILDDSRIVFLNIYKVHHVNGPFVDIMATTEVPNPWVRPDGTNALLEE